MKVLIYEPNGALQKFFTEYMLHNRITPQIVERESTIYAALASLDYQIFLTDYSAKQEFINDIIFNLKLNSNLTSIKIFITTPRPEKEVLKTMIQLGVNGFIKKPFVEEQFANTFGSWLKRNSFENNKRAHTRIKPVPTDNAILSLKLDNFDRDILCEVLDLSIGGLSVELPRSFERLLHNYMKIGSKFYSMRLRIRQVAIRIDFEIVTIIENRLNMKFIDVDEQNMKYLYHYIADKLGA